MSYLVDATGLIAIPTENAAGSSNNGDYIVLAGQKNSYSKENEKPDDISIINSRLLDMFKAYRRG